MQSQVAVEPYITVRELIGYSEEETRKWFEFFRANPASLDVDIGGRAGTIRGLVLHIVTVEYRYAERLLPKEVTDFDFFRDGDLEKIEKWHNDARAMVNTVIANLTPEGLNDVVVSKTRTFGDVAATKRKILIHMMLHGMRHWAQVAIELRRAGYETGMHDFIFSNVLK